MLSPIAGLPWEFLAGQVYRSQIASAFVYLENILISPSLLADSLPAVGLVHNIFLRTLWICWPTAFWPPKFSWEIGQKSYWGSLVYNNLFLSLLLYLNMSLFEFNLTWNSWSFLDVYIIFFIKFEKFSNILQIILSALFSLLILGLSWCILDVVYQVP